MPVEKPDVIDLMTVHPKTNVLALVMVETRDWISTTGSIQQLHEKFSSYARFILTGSLAQQRPDLANSPVCIRLEHFTPITPEVAAALRQWAGRLSGIPIGIFSHRMYWNPIVNLFHRLIEKFTGKDQSLIQWFPEASAGAALLTGKQFTEEFVALVGEKLPKHAVRIVKELHLRITRSDGQESDGFLNNAYNHYLLAPDNKAEIAQKYSASFLETGGQIDEPTNKDLIVPVMKDKAWLQDFNRSLKAQAGQNVMENVHEVYNEELVIAYAEDSPKSIRYLTPARFAELKMESKDLRKLACTNLERLLPTVDIQMDTGVYRIRAGGDYDATLLLLDSVWENGKLDVRGEIVAAVPARDFLVVTGTEDADGLRTLRAMAVNIAAKAPYRLSAKLFVRRGGTFVPFER